MEGTSKGTVDLFSRWARQTVRHPWWILAVWAVLLLVFGASWRMEQGNFVNSLDLPGAESQQAVDLLRERWPDRAGDSALIVVRADAGLSDPAVRAQVDTMTAEAKAIPGVVGVIPPYAPQVGAIAPDGKTGVLLVQFAQQANAVPAASVDALYNLRATHTTAGFQVELGGQVITAGEQTPPSKSEALGIAAAVLILLIAFGSVVAMGLPIVTAFTGLASSFFLIGLLANWVNLSTETRAFTAMIGIGVGIDYALFIVTRYREGLDGGLSVADAVKQSLSTAGRSILFAGSIVVVALLGLSTMGIPFVGALGLAAAVVVTLAVLVALTVLPALLVLVGPRIDKWSVRRPQQVSADHRSVWYRLANFTQCHPWLVISAGLTLLILLMIPAFDMRIGSSDAGNNPTSLTSRRAYDLLTDGFGAGFNGPLTLVIDTSNVTDRGAVDQFVGRVPELPGVERVSKPVTDPAGETMLVSIIPTTSPQSVETQDLVDRLRREANDPALTASGAVAYVGGPTAAHIDMAARISERLPLFFGVVIGVSVLLLLLVFRSIVVPLQAAVMNLLSIGAAYGVLVAIFQWGWFSSIFGIDRTGPIESFLPMMLFAVLFGLSTDYEVFLMSRIHEAWLSTKDNRTAVNHGSNTTSRVITAAAAIMVVVFLSFTLSDARIVKEFGLGMATAVFLDATIIRLLLVPAVTGLFGRANWYLPAWLDRRLPRLALEVTEPHPVDEGRGVAAFETATPSLKTK
ncbi:MAG TPA: MMPL family transporter [Thermomicrobiales bacterium]|nr:MMPL family transporter [Thermomicrobiales bacterium]